MSSVEERITWVRGDIETLPRGKAFDPRLHPRDSEGRFAETPGGGSGVLERSWDGFPFDERKGEGPRPGDTPPKRTPDGDYVMYHGTSRAGASAIEREGIRPDDLGAVGLTTTPEAARIYGLIHDGPAAQVLEVTVSREWLENQRASHEIGGSGHDAFLINPAHGTRGEWSGMPRDAVKDVKRVPHEDPGRLDTPDTSEEVFDAYKRGWESYRKLLHEHGGPNYEDMSVVEPFQLMHVEEARVERVDPEQRAVCEQGAKEFLDDPEMQPYFDEYGKPEIVVASKVIGSDKYAGADPKKFGIVAQWSNGTIFMYAPVVADEEWRQKNQTAGYSVGDGEMRATLIHEYAHQIYGVTGYDEDSKSSQFMNAFEEALTLGTNSPGEAEFSASQVSQYATTNEQECFAEFFTEMITNPNWADFYDGGTLEAMETMKLWIQDDLGTQS